MRKVISLLTVLSLGFFFLIKPGALDVFSLTEHGGANPDSDSYQLTGSCNECHTIHNSELGIPVAPGGPFDQLLVDTFDNSFCTNCHVDNVVGAVPRNPPIQGVWTGAGDYSLSAHGLAVGATNPDSGNDLPRCVSCHDPHGIEDAANPGTAIPGHTVNTEENLCLACHDLDGPALVDIESKLQGTASGTNSYSGTNHYFNTRHDFTDADQTAAGGSKIECTDCHNPHVNNSDFNGISRSKMMDPDPAANGANYTRAYDLANYSGMGGLDPNFGTTVPDFVDFCLTCHGVGAVLPSGVSEGSAAMTEIDWLNNNDDQHGAAPGGRNSGKGYLLSRTVSDPGYDPAYIGVDYRNYSPSSGQEESLSYGPMNCTDCHDPHGVSNNLFMIKTTLNSKSGISWTDAGTLPARACNACHLGVGNHASRLSDNATCSRNAHSHSGGGF